MDHVNGLTFTFRISMVMILLSRVAISSLSSSDINDQTADHQPSSAGLLCISECATCPVICSPPPPSKNDHSSLSHPPKSPLSVPPLLPPLSLLPPPTPPAPPPAQSYYHSPPPLPPSPPPPSQHHNPSSSSASPPPPPPFTINQVPPATGDGQHDYPYPYYYFYSSRASYLSSSYIPVSATIILYCAVLCFLVMIN